MKLFNKVLTGILFIVQISYSQSIQSQSVDFFTNDSQYKNSTDNRSYLLKTFDESTLISDYADKPELGDAPFTAIGTHWHVEEPFTNVQIFIKYKLQSSFESEWILVEVDDDLENDGYKIPGSMLFLPADINSYKIKIVCNDIAAVKNVSLSFINPGKTGEVSKQTISKKQQSINLITEDFELPPIVSRTEWDCPDGQGSRWTPRYTNVSHLIVHHSATENSSSDWAAVVRTFWHWHTIDNGWGDIGYNFLVDPNGVVYEGRSGGNNAMGAHFCGYNSNTMGVCVIGNFTDATPKAPAIASLVKVLSWKCNLESIDPMGKLYHSSSSRTLNRISGHRDGCSTACPGTILYNTLSSVRADVNSLLNKEGPAVRNLAANQSTIGYPAYKPFEITFSQSMNQQSVEDAISITPNDSVIYSWSDAKTITIEPFTQWSFSGSYELRIDTSAKSLFGGVIDGDGDGEPGGEFIHTFAITDVDSDPPYILTGFPTGSNININTEMKFFFNEEVDGIIGRISVFDSLENVVSLADGKIINENYQTYITFRSFRALNPSSEYKIILNAGISDFYGNAMDADTIFNFTTDDGIYPVGYILHNFNDDSQIIDPAENINSQFIVASRTSFKKSGTKAIEGEISGRLVYEMEANTDAQVYIEFNTPLNLSDDDSVASIWVYGDFSGNELKVHFDDYASNVYSLGYIDWYGWDVFEIDLHRLSNAAQSIHGVSIQSTSAGERKGTLYFDELLSVRDDVTNVEAVQKIPTKYFLAQNYPNPFNPATTIEYTIPNVKSQHAVSLKIYDVLGREVATLVNKPQAAGNYSVEWKTSSGSQNISSGVYFYSLVVGNYKSTKKMLLLN